MRNTGGRGLGWMGAKAGTGGWLPVAGLVTNLVCVPSGLALTSAGSLAGRG